MQTTFDRTQEDLGNSVGLEHLNLTIPDQQTAIAFYISGLGLTRDPYLVTGLANMWVNVGRSQFHLPIKDAQAVRGHVALVMPDLAALQRRLEMVKDRLSNTKFGYSKRNGHVEVACPWGNTFHIHAPDRKKFGPMVLGMAHIAFDVPKGAAAGIAQFYNKIIGAPSRVEKGRNGASAKVHVGINQHLIFNETSGTLPPYRRTPSPALRRQLLRAAPATGRTRPHHRRKQPGAVPLFKDRRSGQRGSVLRARARDPQHHAPALCAPDDQSQPGAIESGLQAGTRRRLVGDGLRGMTRRPRALVIGGSLGGLFAANVLREVCAWDVEVFERVENDLAARGAGIATHDEMFDVLRRVGLPSTNPSAST